MNMMSLNKIEKDLTPRFRERLNHAESVEDVKKFFNYTTNDLLNQGLNGEYAVDAGDIALSSDKPHFKLSPEMRNNEAFRRLWNSSDMPVIMARFAMAAMNRHRHLMQNSVKTRLKIKGH